MSQILTAQNVNKKFGNFQALKDVNISIDKGKIVGLIGPNGAGKTTLLKSVLGLDSCDGDLRVLGIDPFKKRDELMKEICFIADVAVLPKWIKVSQLLSFTEDTHPNFSIEQAKAFLKKTKVNMDHKVKELSKGMTAQLHLAIVMSIDAKLLVLDEPTLGLDILFRKQFYDNLLNDYFDNERTIIITTHQVEEIEHILTDVVFIREGEIVLDANMEELNESYFEVMVSQENYQEALNHKPLTIRKVFGKHIMLFKSSSRDVIETLGDVQRPSVSDLFVALMQEEEA
ncbi:ABC transporter ATP-binding protein [Marinicella sp. S1101]|uniref:ABC transporter ATP-binding protein n=1 Tax=Marinicella marina TaxID=2996016 RepID=UPI002260B110|nr:ABC transporter ATP-binding protein [Marinicella marina]MCX7552973.1 ABC transporter ATP-binding protein [Marinicella marina]MDJ1139717.1 ABC transporter ATP-binding protein [Marinicella marina]